MAKLNKKELAALVAESERRNKEKLYSTDFMSYAEDCLQVIHKNPAKGYVPFKLNPAQVLIHEAIEKQSVETEGIVRVIILKARQQGISTYVAGRSFWKTSRNPNTKTAVISHQAKTSEAIFDMSRNFLAMLPDAMRPDIDSDTKQQLKFADTKSSFSVFTANNPEAGRGLTPTIAQASEAAFWQHDEKILAGLMQGVAREPGTEIILESTANGASGKFYELWKGAVAGENSFIPVFIPWHMTEEYSTPDRLMPEKFDRTPDEDKLVSMYELTDNQLHWRRITVSELGLEKFQQEYPSNAQEAFTMAGSAVFDAEKLMKLEPMPYKLRRDFDPVSGYFDSNPHGHFFQWTHRVPDESYVIGADVSKGVGQDRSSATVMNLDGEVVALYSNDRITPTDFGKLLFYIGRDWNHAYLIVEANNDGGQTLQALVDLNYTNLYYRQRLDNFTKEGTDVAGFLTTQSTKPRAIASLRDRLNDGSFVCPSSHIIDEMGTYIAEGSKTNAARGYFDDAVISTALACFALDYERENVARKHSWKSSLGNWNNTADEITWI